MNQNRVKFFLKKDKEESLKRFHPWIFSGAISKVEGEPIEGDMVDVYNHSGEYVAQGHCQIGSISIRVLSFKQEVIDQQWWNNRVLAAYQMRQSLSIGTDDSTNAYRLIHGEGDLLPGLIVDIYASNAVIQAHSVGMYLEKEKICEAIKSVYGDIIISIYDKSSSTLPFNADIAAIDGYVYGSGVTPTVVYENGLKFNIDWNKGQKTGFFLDQRDNRALVQHYSKGKKVLNTFCYTGGFSVYAIAGGATEVDSVDSSARAVELCDENIKLNFGDDVAHTGIVADALDHIKDLGKTYDLIILDPPAFAKHRKVLPNALKGYRRINAQAIRQIAKGGILFTFSCSQAVSKDQFRNSVFSAAAMANRNVKILHQLTQPADHPVNIYHPEGEYLKGLVVYVE